MSADPPVIIIENADQLDTLIRNILQAAIDRGLEARIRDVVKGRLDADRVIGEGATIRQSILDALTGSKDAGDIARRILDLLRAELCGDQPAPRLIQSTVIQDPDTQITTGD